MRDVIALFSNSLNGAVLRMNETRWITMLGGSFRWACELGFMRGPNEPSEIPCSVCNAPGHPAPLVKDAETGALNAFCLAEGMYSPNEAECRIWEFDSAAFIRAITATLGIEDTPRRHGNALIFLGNAKLGRTTYGAFLADDLHDPDRLDALLSLNRAGFGRNPSVILCSALPPVPRSSWGKHPFVKLEDAIRLEGAGIAVRSDILRQAFGLQRSGGSGVPVGKQAEDVFYRELIASGSLPSGVPSLTELFQSGVPDDVDTPGKSTIYQAVSRARRRYETSEVQSPMKGAGMD